jgi:hypothetical protein
MLHSKNLDFSFSGLKTAVLTVVKNQTTNICEQDKANIARAFVDAIVEVLTAKCVTALKHTGLKRLVIAGGVGANQQLRASLNAAAAKKHFKVFYPELEFCTDNGAMIAFAGAMRLQINPDAAQRDYAFNVKPRWPLDSIRDIYRRPGPATPVTLFLLAAEAAFFSGQQVADIFAMAIHQQDAHRQHRQQNDIRPEHQTVIERREYTRDQCRQ